MIILQRYVKEFHGFLEGKRAIIATGPKFSSVAKPDKGKKPFWRMLPRFCDELRALHEKSMRDLDRTDQLLQIGALLLDTEVIQALWLENHNDGGLDYKSFMKSEALWNTGFFKDMVPDNFHGPNDVVSDVLELLDGMASKEHYVSLFSQHDEVTIRSSTLAEI